MVKDSYSTNPDCLMNAFTDIIGTILDIVMVVGALMLPTLPPGAHSWITSAGDKTKTEEARNRMTSAIIGIIILSSAVALLCSFNKYSVSVFLASGTTLLHRCAPSVVGP